MRYGAPFQIETKRLDGEAWEVAGYASTYDRDLGDDVVTPGAFAKSLGSGRPVRFLYSHDPSQVLGTVQELKEDDRGLYGRFAISKTGLGRDVHTLLKDGALDSFSIGYLPTDFEHDRKAGVRRLTEVELLEVSVVAMPMNPAAVVTGVKAADYAEMDPDDIERVFLAHQSSLLAWAEAHAEHRRSEKRELSGRALRVFEAVRAESERLAARLLELATTPAPAKAHDSEATAEAATRSLVEAHLRRARLNELRRAYGMPRLGASA